MRSPKYPYPLEINFISIFMQATGISNWKKEAWEQKDPWKQVMLLFPLMELHQGFWAVRTFFHRHGKIYNQYANGSQVVRL